MGSLKALVLELLILANYHWYLSHSTKLEIEIGALLSSREMTKTFRDAVLNLNTTVSARTTSYDLRFTPLAYELDVNALKAAKQVCKLVGEAKLLAAVIVSHPPNRSDIPPLSTSFTCAFYNIPVIGVTARESALSDKYSHSSFLRTVPPFSQEAEAWADLIRKFRWKEVNFIHSDDEEGKTLLGQLQRVAENQNSRRFRVISKSYQVDNPRFEDLLQPISGEQTRAVVLDAGPREAEAIFAAAARFNMLGEDWGWIISEQALGARNVPQGMITLQLSQSAEELHIKDAVAVTLAGIKAVLVEGSSALYNTRTPSDCEKSLAETEERSQPAPSWRKRKFSKVVPLKPWGPIGADLFRKIISVKLEKGATGRVQFDRHGNRVRPLYRIVNSDRMNGRLRLNPVGKYGDVEEDRFSTSVAEAPNNNVEDNSALTSVDGRPTEYQENHFPKLSINMSQIYWPGRKRLQVRQQVCVSYKQKRCTKRELQTIFLAPRSFKKKKNLRVVTKESVPFVYKKPKPPEGCKVQPDPTILRGEVECTHRRNGSTVDYEYCCSGYCVDLLRRLANRTNIEPEFTPFEFTLYLVPDDKVGEEIKEPGQAPRWNGIMGELMPKSDESMPAADLAVAPMTISPDRATHVEFTKPYKYLGLTILVKRNPPKSNLASFLQPFENTLWVLVALSVHVVALVLYLLDRFSPFGRFKLAKSSDTEEDALNLSSAMWFAWGVLLNSGIGEGTPRSFSARVLGMVWAGFAMIIVASYTANLAAFLVLDRPEASITGIDDARLRNPQKDFKFATVRKSPVEEYFQRQVEYTTMYRHMEKHNYATPEDAIEAVKEGKKNGLKAFIWDSARLNFEAAMDCELITAGDVFGRTGYGLAMPRHSPWKQELSQAVLNFHERGFMESLDTEWILIKSKECTKTKTSPATLGLTNMAGVFIMVAAGIVAGVFLIFIEIAYKRRRGLKEKELELAKTAADRWRGNIEKRKILRRTLAAERAESAKDSVLLGAAVEETEMRPNGRVNQSSLQYDSRV